MIETEEAEPEIPPERRVFVDHDEANTRWNAGERFNMPDDGIAWDVVHLVLKGALKLFYDRDHPDRWAVMFTAEGRAHVS